MNTDAKRIKARLAAAERRWQRHDARIGYPVYRAGKPAYWRKPKQASIWQEVAFVAVAMLLVVGILYI